MDTRKASGIVSSWFSGELKAYLLALQAEYRVEPLPKPEIQSTEYMRLRAEEAQRNIFNADHIICILVGWRGPWLHENEDDTVRINLPFMVERLQELQDAQLEQEATKPARTEHNRRLQAAINLVRALPLAPAQNREDVVRRLEGMRRPSTRVLATKIGITQSPSKPSRQRFWDPLVLHLFSYLHRTTRENEGKIFSITARILHLASGGQYPDEPALIKSRWYRQYQ